MKLMIQNELRSHLEVIQRVSNELQNHIYTACVLATDTLSNGNKIIIFGNGGSAADAQHFAAEIVGRYKVDRRGLPAISLATDTSALTAIANDFGYKNIFSRQVEALAHEGDLLVGISTSGNSKNVIKALKKGKNIGCRTIGLSGGDGGSMSEFCDLNIIIPSSNTPRVQEMHILIIHTICQAIDRINS